MASLAVIVGMGISVVALYVAIRMALWCRNIWLTLAGVPGSAAILPLRTERLVLVQEPVSVPVISMSTKLVEEESAWFEEAPAESLRVEPEIPVIPVFTQSTFFFEDGNEMGTTHPQAEVWEWKRSLSTTFAEETSAAERIRMVEVDSPTSVARGFSGETAMDPIDGTALVPGEPIIPCGCGLIYRRESVEWLVSGMDGRCVQCGESLRGRLTRALSLA